MASQRHDRTPAYRREVGAYYREHGRKATLARYGVPEGTAKAWARGERLGTINNKGKSTEDPPPTPLPPDAEEAVEHELGPAAWTIQMRSRTICTYEQLVAACKVNLDEWEQVTFRVRSYQITTVPRATRDTDRDADGNHVGWVRPSADPETRTMYAVSASFKKKIAVVSARQEIEALLAEARATMPARGPLVLVKSPETGYLLEIGPPDAHFNKLAWGRETGGPDYDLSIAVDAYTRAVETLLARSSHLRFQKALYVVGHDALHTDNLEGTTTKGTRQDTDTRFIKGFQTARRTIIAGIERALEVAGEVLVVGIQGNHDALTALCLLDSIACWYHGHPRVTVDAEPRLRKYVRWGQVALGFTHGDKGKPELWSRLMPVEARDIWGATTYREVHVGHFHKDAAEKDELNGVKVRLLPSLAPPDAWHAAQGFVGNVPAAEAFFWHADDGLVGTAHYAHRYDRAA